MTNDVGTIWTNMRESWVDSSGARGAARVRTTWVARRMDGRWRVVYVDARHGPLSADSVRAR